MAQSPTIAIPKKSTDEVDWTGPIRAIIKASYGENPDNYATECAALQRCRQDAVRGAGSDLTAASLLTKYFGQLELLELRFSEIRVSFPWRDAFTSKLTTQTSIAFEKASIIYQIAATHSIIASAQNRSDPEGLKRAYYYFRTCAGMLTYINDNFLHAPSTDLSREVVKFLVGIMMAQANETFYETCVDQRKSPALIAKIASHTTFLYNGLCEEVKEFFGKGIFDRNWVTLLQIKAKYFTSLMQYQRSLADTAAGKHGEALARMGVAESNAKEAHKLSSSFAPYFVNTLSTTLPADTGTAILELTKNHLALCTEKYTQGQKDNDLIYNDHVPSEATLSPVDKVSAVTPVPIHEVYGTPEVQKTIGPDLFAKLIPLSVHEAASVYSEEKAKIVRAEVEKAEVAEGEVKASVESLGVKAALGRYKEIAEGEVDESVPATVLSWHEEIQRKQGVDGLEKQLKELEKLKETVARELDAISESLAVESRECEMMRVKFGHRWTQEPSGGPVKDLRRDLKDHRSSLEAAAPSDQQIYTLWDSIRADLALLVSKPKLEAMFASAATGGNAAGDLLDVSEGDTDDADREKMKKLVREIEERLGRLNKISRERNEILKDLKEKVQNDDVSHVLLLNRRNAGVEPSLFATELEKFRPYQSRLAATTHAQQTTIQEIAHMWKSLKDKGGKNKGAKKWEERERRVMALVKRFASAREGYLEVSDGLMKGLQFYKDLTTLAKTLQERASAFLSARNRERESLSGRLEIEHRLESLPSPNSTTSSSGPPPALPPPPPRPLESHFGSMKISSPPPPQTQVQTPNAWQQHQPQHSHQRGPSLSAGTLPTSVYPQQSPGISPYGQPSPVTSSYLPASAPPAAAAAPPPPPQHSFSSSPYGQPQRQGTLSLPLSPPPPPPPSTVTSPPAAAPMSDPYAGLSSHFTLGGPSPPPQPQPQPPQQQYQSYGTPSYQPNQPQQQQQSVYGQHPTAPTYGTAQGYSAYQPSPTQSPPPPQHQHQQHQQQPSYGSQMGYASHGYGTQPMGGGYSTTGGYGSPAYLPPQQQQQQGQPPTAPAPYTASAFPPPPPQHTSSYQYPR